MLFAKMDQKRFKVRQYIKLYGLSGTLLRMFKSVIYRCVGFRWERCFLMSRSLDTICPPLVQAELEVRELSLVDYDNALWQGYLTEERRRLYEERFNEKRRKHMACLSMVRWLVPLGYCMER